MFNLFFSFYLSNFGNELLLVKKERGCEECNSEGGEKTVIKSYLVTLRTKHKIQLIRNIIIFTKIFISTF